MFKNLKSSFKDSFNNLKSVKTITTCSILMAFAVYLSLFTLRVGSSSVKIGFSTVITLFVGYIFGPFVSGIFGGLLDVLQYLENPFGAYQFVWTLNGIITGVIYGVVLYKRTPTFKNVLLARFLSGIIVSTLLTTLWLCIYYGIAKAYELPLVAIKELVLIFIHSIIIHRVLKILKIESR